MEKEKVKSIKNSNDLTQEQLKNEVLSLLHELNEKRMERNEELKYCNKVNRLAENHEGIASYAEQQERKRYDSKYYPTSRPRREIEKIYKEIDKKLHQHPELKDDKDVAKELEISDYEHFYDYYPNKDIFEKKTSINIEYYENDNEDIECEVYSNDLINSDETATLDNFISLLAEDEKTKGEKFARYLAPTSDKGIDNIAEKMSENENFKEFMIKEIYKGLEESLEYDEIKEEDYSYLLKETFSPTTEEWKQKAK